jgi:uncharacterized protein YodC (DUF2158 family)
MAWHVALFKFARQIGDLSELSASDRPISLGMLEDVRSAVDSTFPGTVWRDSASGSFAGEIGSIDFEIKTPESAEGVDLHVRASDEVVRRILSLRERLSCQAYDGSTDTFLERSDQPERGLHKWRAYEKRFLADPDEWKAGDVVARLDGSPAMTITSWTPHLCHAMWFDNEGHLHGEDFDTNDLACITRAEAQDAGEFDQALGMRVRLASGGVHMTVIGWSTNTLRAQWQLDQTVNEVELPVGSLVQV